MNSFQKFIADHPGGFLKDTDMPALISLHRLCPVVVRCGGCRFVAGAQDVPHLLKCIKAGGDYVRDVSFPVGAIERAASWKPEITSPGITGRIAVNLRGKVSLSPSQIAEHAHNLQSKRRVCNEEGVDWICTGNFDGNTCGTDADSGL